MTSIVEPSWLGRRVSVRRVVDRDPDGRLLFGDVVGELAGLDAQTAVIEARQGLVEVPLALVVAGRLVAPSTADELALERIAARGWRAADTLELDGWLLRADGGFTRRANSVTPLGQLRRPVDDALTQVRAWYDARGLPAVIQVPLDARRLLDAELAERGWTASARTIARDVRLPAATGHAARPEVELTDEPSDDWLALYRADEAPRHTVRGLLTRHDTAVFAEQRIGGELVALARGCVDDAWLGITAVQVQPEHRRAGRAQDMIRALWAWGADNGARRGYVQVAADNAPALALYEGLGYRHHHDYHYRQEPDAGAVDHSLPGSVPAPYA